MIYFHLLYFRFDVTCLLKKLRKENMRKIIMLAKRRNCVLIPSLNQKSTTEMNTFMNIMQIRNRDLSQKRLAVHSTSTYHKDPEKVEMNLLLDPKQAITKI